MTHNRQCSVSGCRRKATRNSSLCEVCRTLCARCRKEPRENKNGSYCTSCRRTYARDYLSSSDIKRRDSALRVALRKRILKGKAERTPCVICGREPSVAYFPNMTLETVTFLCKEHRKQLG